MAAFGCEKDVQQKYFITMDIITVLSGTAINKHSQ